MDDNKANRMIGKPLVFLCFLSCFMRLAHNLSYDCSELTGDGFCNDEINHAGCSFDGGDCCGHNVIMTKVVHLIKMNANNMSNHYVNI